LNDAAQFWADPRLVYPVAVFAVVLLLASIYLFRRRRREGRQAGVVCLLLSIVLHALLIFLVPYLTERSGGSATVAEQDSSVGAETIPFATFETEMNLDDASGQDEVAAIAPLPIDEMLDVFDASDSPIDDEVPSEAELTTEPELTSAPGSPLPAAPPAETVAAEAAADPSIDALQQSPVDDLTADIESAMDAWLSETKPPAVSEPRAQPPKQNADAVAQANPQPIDQPVQAQPVSTSNAARRTVVGDLANDFANRVGSAKEQALDQTGGSAETEAAVQAALKFLAESQRTDGSWDPVASGAGRERAPLGMNRGGAGRQANTAITGLALLAMIGAGNTHAQGEYADHVYRGLSYLIRQQKPDGSLAGNAAVYAANYSHGMAALAMCEAAAITGDPSAAEAARRAMAFTVRMQHPSTGGWRYTAGDSGDLSQTGWQVMVLDAGQRAGIPVSPASISGVRRFLRSVRAGTGGSLASYRPGEAASRTMTAEALATRLLIGEQVPSSELIVAERYLLQQPPGIGQDNYYYWYYATLALHQLQDEAWRSWNQSLQRRLLTTQRSDGSWPTTSVWGGYGGSIYTASMGALCLETYYRHAIRRDQNRVAGRESALR
tara:strand:- start:31299 stop:33125 length:1827 start_codon:yes stop_codon:yes gene_type:complete